MCQQTTPLSRRTCVMCQGPLIGRSDKVFCDIKCKNAYHIEARKTKRTAASRTNAILAKNYIILAGLMADGSQRAVISRLALADIGFNFQYITEVNHDNGVFRFGIYDISWKFVQNDAIAIEVLPDRSPVSPFVFERWRRIYEPLDEHSGQESGNPENSC